MNQHFQTVETRIGKLVFDERGLPSSETVAKLFDELDFQYAVQAYIWSLPIVGTLGWHNLNRFHGATGETDKVAYAGFEGSMGILTPTAAVTYVFVFPNLSKTGPLVWEVPPGALAGSVMDYWQRALGDFGVPGPDRGQGDKLLLIGPGQAPPEDTEGYRVIQISTVYAFLGVRILNPDDVSPLSSKLLLYPFDQRDNPPEQRLIFAKDKHIYVTQPGGLAYWESVNEVIQREPVHERDRFHMAMLKQLGIEKGKPFAPDERQRELLEEAAIVGEKMAMAFAFDRYKRDEAVRYRDDSHWKYLLTPPVPSQQADSYDVLEERASYAYEAIATAYAMVSQTPGVGSRYLAAYQDADGAWLDGGANYHLRVPANPPAQRFWAFTIYSTETRSFLENAEKKAETGSRSPDLVTNRDGTVDLFFGPEAPEGRDSNWLQTNPGEGWFAIIRFYGPTEAYIERTWFLPDIEKAED